MDVYKTKLRQNAIYRRCLRFLGLEGQGSDVDLSKDEPLSPLVQLQAPLLNEDHEYERENASTNSNDQENI